LAFVVLPQPELWAVTKTGGTVDEIHIRAKSGNVDVAMGGHYRLKDHPEQLNWSVHFRFDSDLRLLNAHSGSGYDAAHEILYKLGEIDHSFRSSEDHDIELVPVRRWENGKFVDSSTTADGKK
jgi:hypothetical protein